MAQELLSALLDGECTPAELDRVLDEMQRSPELKDRFSRLCMAREVGEGIRIGRQQPCICADVMSRVASEPMLASPGPNTVDLDSRRRWFRFKPLAGLAAAASVAAVAVLVSVPALRQEPMTSASAGLVPEAAAPAAFSQVSVPANRRRSDLRAVAFTPEQAEQMAELNELLLEHSGAMAEQGVSGTLRYARVAAHARPAVYRPELTGGGNR
jgi:negative regulator of sigma E activity